MAKKDFDINISAGNAFMVDELRWKRAKSRSPTLTKLYDLRFDKKKLKLLKKSESANSKEISLLLGNKGSLSWPEYLGGDAIRVENFEGYIGRVLQNKDNSYYVEIPQLGSQYNPAPPLFALSGLSQNIKVIEFRFRYLFEPFTPGRIIHIQYINVDNFVIEGRSYKVPLAIQIERDFEPEPFSQLIEELSEEEREYRYNLYREVSVGPNS